MANPFLNSPAFDYVLIAGIKSPGKAKVTGGGRANKWDEQKPSGSSGASLTYKGRDLVKFKVSFEFIKSTEYAEWQDKFAPILKKEPNSKAPQALQFYHPFITDELDVKAVVVEKVYQPEESGNNIITVNVDFIEYAPPKPSSSPIKGAKDKGGSKKQPVAKDELDKALDAERAEFNKNYGKKAVTPGGASASF